MAQKRLYDITTICIVHCTVYTLQYRAAEWPLPQNKGKTGEKKQEQYERHFTQEYLLTFTTSSPHIQH